jgi:hypothetical protein
MRTNNDRIVWCVPTNDFLDCSNRAELQVRIGFATDVNGGAGILSIGGIVAWVRSAYLGDSQMFPQTDVYFAEALIEGEREANRCDQWLDGLQATYQVAAIDCLDRSLCEALTDTNCLVMPACV